MTQGAENGEERVPGATCRQRRRGHRCRGNTSELAHRAVFADGPVDGMVVVVHGVLGAVGTLAAQLAHRGGATVIGTVRKHADLARVNATAVKQAVWLDGTNPIGAVRSHAPEGVDRIIEVAFSDNVELDAAVVRNEAVIAAYATRGVRNP
jgi:NADPH:quinone reductase